MSNSALGKRVFSRLISAGEFALHVIFARAPLDTKAACEKARRLPTVRAVTLISLFSLVKAACSISAVPKITEKGNTKVYHFLYLGYGLPVRYTTRYLPDSAH